MGSTQRTPTFRCWPRANLVGLGGWRSRRIWHVAGPSGAVLAVVMCQRVDHQDCRNPCPVKRCSSWEALPTAGTPTRRPSPLRPRWVARCQREAACRLHAGCRCWCRPIIWAAIALAASGAALGICELIKHKGADEVRAKIENENQDAIRKGIEASRNFEDCTSAGGLWDFRRQRCSSAPGGDRYQPRRRAGEDGRRSE